MYARNRRAFQQAQECIACLVCAHLFAPQIATRLHPLLGLNLIVKAAGLLDLSLPLRLLVVTSLTRMLHIPYHTLRILA